MSLQKASDKEISNSEVEYIAIITLIRAIKADVCFLNALE